MFYKLGRRFLTAAATLCLLSCFFPTIVLAQTYSLTPATSGCYQAKCTRTLTNDVNVAPPTTLNSTPKDQTVGSFGSGAGLGCSSNTSVVACSFNGSGTRFNPERLFNANGTEISVAPATFFDTSASQSAPIVFADGGVLAVDDTYIGYTPPAHNVWYADTYSSFYGKSFLEPPKSPAIMNVSGTTYVFVATSCTTNDLTSITSNPSTETCGAGLYKMLNTGSDVSSSNTTNNTSSTLFSSGSYDPMVMSSIQYSTVNSPAVDTVYNRVYVSTNVVTTTGSHAGRIIAYDVTSSGLSAPQDVWDFPGPSGASPVVYPNYSYTIPHTTTTVTGTAIFFDGTARSNDLGGPTSNSDCTSNSETGGGQSGCFYGVLDTSHYGSINQSGTQQYIGMWQIIFPNSDFQAGAGLDTSGTPGIWVFPVNQASYYGTNCPLSGTTYTSYNNCLVKLKLTDGSLVQGPVNLTPIVTGGSGYQDATSHSDVVQPSSALAVSYSGSNTYLTLAADDKFNSSFAGMTVTIDVTGSSHTSAPFASYVWATAPYSSGYGLCLGQFATATYTDIHGTPITNIFFTGQYFGPEIIGNY